MLTRALVPILLAVLLLGGCKTKKAGAAPAKPPAEPRVEAETPPVVAPGEKAGPLAPGAIKPHGSQYAHSGLPPAEIAKVALMHEARGEFEQALEVLDTGLEHHPKSAVLYAVRGALYLQLGKNQAAIKDLTKSLEIKEDPDVYTNRALAEKAFGDREAALKDLNRALKLNPHHLAALFNRGTLYLEMGNYQDAIQDFTKAIELDPKAPGPYFNRAVAYHQLGDDDEAIADLKTFIQLAPKESWKNEANKLIEEWQHAR